jgi:GT2 family glycosyltransferase
VKIARFTFNGVLVPRETVARVGSPRADFFVGMEDWEYSKRLGAAGLDAFEATHALLLHPTKGNLRFGVRPSVLRSYYATRNWMHVSLAEQPTLLRTAKCCGWCVASIPRILIREDHKLRRSAARVTATFDALSGRMGRRNYWFLR